MGSTGDGCSSVTDALSSAPPSPLPRAFYQRPTAVVAQELVGKVLARRRGPSLQLARIVEVEAYLGERDAASHARNGPTPRAAIMFGPPGFLYVYFVYGMHHCMNFVTEEPGVAGAVLIRAAEPLAGFDGGGEARPLRGPGKLCAALGITIADKGRDLTAPGDFCVVDDLEGARARRPAVSRRVGVDYAGAWAARKLRFYVAGNPHVSGRPR
jgi:DNA-3-methyladenine glycosylase